MCDYIQIPLAPGLFRALFPGIFSKNWFLSHDHWEHSVLLWKTSTCPNALRRIRYVCLALRFCHEVCCCVFEGWSWNPRAAAPTHVFSESPHVSLADCSVCVCVRAQAFACMCLSEFSVCSKTFETQTCGGAKNIVSLIPSGFVLVMSFIASALNPSFPLHQRL